MDRFLPNPNFKQGVDVFDSKWNKLLGSYASSKRDFRVFAMSSVVSEASTFIQAAPIFLPEGPWKQGFKAAGMYGGLRAVGQKPDLALALVTCDVDAVAVGTFTKNVVAAAPVLYCKNMLEKSKTARAVLINAGQANAATGDACYQDVIDCSNALAKLLEIRPDEILIESTGVIGQRIEKEPLLSSLPKLISLLSSSVNGADSAAVAITTTDLVSKSVAVEFEVGGTRIRIGVITTDAVVDTDVWRMMIQVAVNRSFNQIITVIPGLSVRTRLPISFANGTRVDSSSARSQDTVKAPPAENKVVKRASATAVLLTTFFLPWMWMFRVCSIWKQYPEKPLDRIWVLRALLAYCFCKLVHYNTFSRRISGKPRQYFTFTSQSLTF